MKKKLLVIGQGRIGGTYCESFWGIDTDGKTGYECYRYPFAEEIPLMLADLARHRKKLREELKDLAQAERLLKRAQADEQFRARTPPGYK
ncbi:hypothetical protein [Nitrospira sp. BLG_2]|uniref:hypothetical protein n=1 Tax=Nitrospira sp. BLG_2 TaxID=3397507 RepID=UPI003B9D51C0